MILIVVLTSKLFSSNMKKILISLRSFFSFGDLAQSSEPTDPIELHDYLYLRASALVKPHLILHNIPTQNTNNNKVKKDLETAISLFERVLRMNDQNWAAAWQAGKAAQSLDDQELAYRFFKKSFGVMKENPDVARELMLTCLDTRRADEAVEIAEHGVRLAEGDAGLKANLALALLCAGKLSGAETAIDAAIQQAPQDEISLTLKRLIVEIKRGERKLPQTPADLQI
jgi:Flp pilus assembly protein TadD